MENMNITDTDVIAFYKDHPELDINHINRVFIDILKQLSINFSRTLDNTMTTQILSIVSDIKGELYKLNSDIAIKLNDVKKDYIEDIKTLFSHSELSTQEK